jgi:REP element-mobilizing transposase RayT
MQARLLATMVTTTSYGSWLPGDIRGYVDNGIILPGDPTRLQQATRRMKQAPVLFTTDQQSKLFDALQSAALEFNYELTDASVENWHLHWMCQHGFASIATMVGRLKNRMRQALNIGRTWTEGYFDSKCFEPEMIAARRGYIAKHAGCRMTDGRIVVAGRPLFR